MGAVHSTDPLALAAGHLVYSVHDYSFFHKDLGTYDQFHAALGDKWGFLLTAGRPFTAPVRVGEFGTCHTAATCVDDVSGAGLWFSYLRRYLADADVDWSYWAVNGTQARGTGRTPGAEESYGVLDRTWTGPALKELIDALQALQPITQRP